MKQRVTARRRVRKRPLFTVPAAVMTQAGAAAARPRYSSAAHQILAAAVALTRVPA
ncbi:MAG: hypothetical protein M0Z41_09040 [Peptococcaceae bacterium]|nr:hypothetical protein [Peptococcaceae bacterium]